MARVEDRVLGEKLALSVPTAIPFEEQVVGHSPKVDMIWINLQTAFRNYHGAFEDALLVERGAFLAGFNEELHVIRHLMDGEVDVRYYFMPDRRLAATFPLAKLKRAHTQKQLLYANIERLAIGNAIRDKSLDILDLGGRLLLPHINRRVWLLTHHPLDLMSRYQFSDLQLLESHTGALKGPKDWITKLSSSAEHQHLPFNLLTLQVLGDKGNQFYALSSRYKKALMEVARLGKWTPLTTRDKVKMDLNKLEDSDLIHELSSMLMSNLQ